MIDEIITCNSIDLTFVNVNCLGGNLVHQTRRNNVHTNKVREKCL